MKVGQFMMSVICTMFAFETMVVLAAKSRNLYDILGVKKNAKEKDIKRAFRKLAIQYHPDKNKDKDAEAKFVEIAKAYGVLSDPEKRRKYDQFGDDGESSNGGGGGGGGGGFDFNFGDFFKGFDEAFHSHSDPNHQHNHFKFHFGDGGNGQKAHFFNFDDLFEDDTDSDFFNFDPFSDMDFGFEDDLFSPNHDNHYDHAHNAGQHQRHHQQHHQQMHQANVNHANNMHQHHHFQQQQQQVKFSSHAGGAKCRTVTQRIGNMVTTHTECS